MPETAPAKMLNSQQVCDLMAFSPATLWRLIRAKRFPAPLKVGPQTVRWRADELTAYQDRISAERAA